MRCLALLFGAAAGLPPLAAGLRVFTDPLTRKAREDEGLARVASLELLPADGAPRKFTVVADQTDAWNKFPRTPVGAVYLRRTGEKSVEALNVVCPHAGCFVDYRAEDKHYYCPCHHSTFALDGSIKDPGSPSPRAMDTLAVEIRNASEVWVKFQNFIAGHKEKRPVA